MQTKVLECLLIGLAALQLPQLRGEPQLVQFANAELRMDTLCVSSATIGIIGSENLSNMLYTDAYHAAESHSAEVDIVERNRLEAILAEHALSDSAYIDPSTTVATDRLIGAKFLVKISGNPASLPTTISTEMIRVDTQEIVYERSFEFTEAQGVSGLNEIIAQIAEEIVNAAVNHNYPCYRRGTLSYVTHLNGQGWAWKNSGYFDFLFRDGKVIVRHVPLQNTPSGLLVSATQPPFPHIPQLEATAQFDPSQPSSDPVAYAIQFQRPSSPAPEHQLTFDETPNPVLMTGRQNQLEFNHWGAIALGQWMRRSGNANLRLVAETTQGTPNTWTVPVGTGQMVLTWRLD